MKRLALFALCFVVLAGCASQPQGGADLHPDRLPLDAGKGRVYFYAYKDFINVFEVSVNGVVIGMFRPGQAIMIDLKAGHYTAQARVKTIWGTFGPPIGTAFDLKGGESLCVGETIYTPNVLPPGGALNYLLSSNLFTNNDPAHPSGTYFEVRSHSEEIEGKTFLVADPKSVAALNAQQ